LPTAVERAEKATPRSALRRRRGEVVERLAAYGLARGPHRVARAAGEGEGRASSRLRAALEGLGPVFSCFGLYMATRVDLMSACDCVELAALPDRAPPATHAAVRDLFRREIGCAPEEAFPAFEEEPFESRLLYQSHRARLPDGAPAVVKIIRPEAEQRFLCDAELLHLLEGALAGVVPCGAPFKSAVADFTAALGQQMDFTCEARALETLARDAEEFGMVRAPSVQLGLCTARVMVVEELKGYCLGDGEFSRAEREGSAGARPRPSNVFDRTNLARLLCSVWLRQALFGHVFPVEPRPANVVVLSDGQVAFTGGLFAGLPAESQSNIWNYLTAAAAENPDRACSCLIREVRRKGPPGGEEDLRHRLRQVVPFRDSEWYRDDDINRLAEHLVVHWRAAAECGYVPQPHLPSFYRGLFAIASTAQQLSPESDPLLEGLQDARMLAGLAQMREIVGLQQFGDHLDRYAAMMAGLPQRFDEMLTLASEGGARVRLRVPEAASRRHRKNSSAAFAALLLAFAAAALLLPHVTASLVAREWANGVNAVVFVACGALLLRVAGRAG
jgi:predicted unusual protein kinase regulating ubiquinone biosynthesis (AarF/ABC1/UbiB family)